MFPSIVLFKQADNIPPKEVLEAACERFNKTVGFLRVVEETIEINREAIASNANTTHSMMEENQAFPMVLFLSNAATGVDKIQPFTLHGPEDKPDAVVFIQGDVSILDRLRKKFQKELKANDGDIHKLWEVLQDEDDTTGGEFEAILEPNSAMYLVSKYGSVLCIENADIDVTIDEWGSYLGEVKPEDGGTESTPPKPADGFKGRSMGGGPVAVPTPASQQIAASGDKVKIVRPAQVPMAEIRKEDVNSYLLLLTKRLGSTEKARKRLSPGNKLMFDDPNYEPHIRCPETIRGLDVNKDRNKEFHLAVCGVDPDNWKLKPMWPISVVDMDAYNEYLKGSTSTATITSATKDVEPKHKPVSPKPDDSSLNDLRSSLAKVNGANTSSQPIIDKMFEEDEKFDMLAAVGKDSGWPGVPLLGRIMICTDDPENGARLWGAYQVVAKNQRQRIKDLEARVAEQDEEIQKLNSAITAGTNVKKPAFGSTGKK